MELNSRFSIYVKFELIEWQLSQFFMILSEEWKNFWMISCEIAKIKEIWLERKFKILN